MPWVEELSDTRELRRCIRDLVALSTLPAVWKNYGPQQIADSVAAALVSMLRADFVYFAAPVSRGDEAMIEVAHTGKKPASGVAHAIRPLLSKVSSRGSGQIAVLPNPLGDGSVRIATAPIGFAGEAVLAAGSTQPDFPTEAQRLLLGIAANDATIALHRWQVEADEQRFVSLVERSSEFVGFAGLDGRAQFVNPAGLSLVGLSEGEDISRLYILDFIASEHRLRARDECLPLVLRSGRWLGELNFRQFQTGESIPFLVDWFRIDNPRDGRPMNLATVSRDLRAQKQAEAELRRLNEALERRVIRRTAQLAATSEKLSAEVLERRRADLRLQELQSELLHAGRLSAAGQMAAALAHELNQPLTAMANSASAARRLLARTDQSAAVREVMDELVEQSLRGGEILRRLREFVTRGETEKRVEDVATMIEEASAFSQTGFEALGMVVQFRFDADAATAFVNRVQFQQVLVNMMRNAFEAMAGTAQRELSIGTARQDEETIEITVADRGPGLAPEVVSHMFEPFISTRRDGMGLGLSICRSIVESHGGRIHHEPNPGGGTIFKFTVPAASPAGSDHGG
jgi:PAS domain S-box-containing protein